MKTVNQLVMPATTRINQGGRLEIGGCDLTELAAEFGTPLYVIDEMTFRESCREYWRAFAGYEKTRMFYASKANINLALCHILRQEGFGLEVVSGGEIFTAQKARFPLSDVSFNGNNKSASELQMAIESGVGRIVADNFSELEMLNGVAEALGKKVSILLRVTPGIECHTHEYIRTGQIDSKFGFDLSQLDEALRLITGKYGFLEIKGLHAHIGSQIFELEVYADEVTILMDYFARIREKFGITLTELNLGGGLGIRYVMGEAPPSRYSLARTIIESIGENCRRLNYPEPILILEPGRSISGTAGVTLYTVGTKKRVPDGNLYVAVDGGMADNPRPAMYQARYEAIIAGRASEAPHQMVTIAGKYCESGDILIKNIKLPDPKMGDILCVFNTGAYNNSMASNYNSNPRPSTVLLCCGKADIIEERETYEQLIQRQRIPERLHSGGCSCEESLVALHGTAGF